jgi:chromosome segregation ATPase
VKIYIMIAVGLVVLGLLGVVKHQRGTIADLRTENGALQAKLDTAVGANESQAKAIVDLESAIKEWEKLAMTPAEVAGKLEELSKSKAQIQELADTLRRSQRDETPACLAWRKTDLSVACPAIDRRLRDLAAGGGASPHG